MRVLFLTSVAAALAVASVAAADSNTTNNPATLCLDGLGINHPPLCHSQEASRFPAAPDICICKGPYQTVKAPWCAPGEKPPADTADFDRARAAAAQKGDLMSFTYQGKRACVPLGPEG